MPREAPSIQQGVRGRDDGRMGLLVRMPYTPRHEQLHDELRALPKMDRYFWPERDAWWVSAAHLEALKTILLRYWPSVLILGRDGEPDILADRAGSAIQSRLAL